MKMRNFASLILACVLFYTTGTAFAAPEYTEDTDLVEGPNMSIILQAADVKKNEETGEVTFRSVSNSFRADTNTYVIDENTTFSTEQDREAFDHFVSGEYPLIGVEYPKELYWELGKTDFQRIHVDNITTILKYIVMFPTDSAGNETSSLSATDFIDIPSASPYAPALYRLKNLGIMRGYPDGSFDADGYITRAEMAKSTVCVNGYTEAMPETETEFTDVPAAHWASGYISFANSLGYIKGNGDGTFLPDENTRYEEAIAMLIAVLGYTPLATQRGTFPDGYLAVADEIGLTEGVEGAARQPVSRGDVALLLNNALDIPLMMQTVYGSEPEYQIMDGTNGTTKSTLLDRKFNS